jgi:hypothetical protein
MDRQIQALKAAGYSYPVLALAGVPGLEVPPRDLLERRLLQLRIGQKPFEL